MPTKNAPTFAPGDRIAYSVAFLRSTGQRTGSAPQMRATVLSSTEIHAGDRMGQLLAFVTDQGQESGGIACNFTLVSRIGIDSALNT